MAKMKTNFVCQECGYSSPRWLGKCPNCNTWNSLVEEIVSKDIQKNISNLSLSEPQSINSILMENEVRIDTNLNELNRVLGGGG